MSAGMARPITPGTNPVQSALQALVNGTDVEQAVYGTPSSTGAAEKPVETSEESAQDASEEAASESSSEQPEASSEETPSEESSEEMAAKKEDIEEIIFSDEEGRKKLKVDWNNREQIKKYISMAAGMRKFQAKADKAEKSLKSIEPEYKELKTVWSKVEEAFSTDGYRGLVNLMSGDPKGYDKLIANEYNRMKTRQELQETNPEGLKALELQEQLEAERKQKLSLEKKFQEQMEKLSQKDEEVSKKELQALMTPAFSKYRMSGKLGNSEAEAKIDKAIWRDAMETLQEIPDDVELTVDMVNKAFANASSTFRTLIKQEAEKKTKQVLQQKKTVAQEKVAKKVINSTAPKSTAREEFTKDIKKGDFAGALKSMLLGKVKL